MKHGISDRAPERGQVLIIIALSLIGIVAVVALVIDGGNVFLDRRSAQNAADSAALAGAFVRLRGGEWAKAAVDAAARNGYDNDGVTNTVRVYSPPISGPYEGDIEYIQIEITSHVKTYFASVVGWKEITNTVTAVSRTKRPEITELVNGNAVVSLAPTSDCQNKKSFWLHGEGTLDITGGGVFVNSNNPNCALIQQGSGSIRIRDDHSISIVGGASIQKPQLLTPSVTVGATSFPYPPAPFMLPKITCGKQAQVSADGESMSPGNWDDDFPPLGVKKLESGTYCVNGSFIVNGGTQLSGSRVVIKVEHGEVRFNGDAAIDLGAPTKGDFAGLLIYLPPDNHSKVVLNGNHDSFFRGTILAPGSPIIIKGNHSQHGFRSQIIGYTIESDGNSNVVIIYKSDQNYHALNMPEIQFSQ